MQTETAVDLKGRLQRLEREKLETEERIDGLRVERSRLLEEASTAARRGVSPNGARAKVQDATIEVEILTDALRQIEQELPAARRALVTAMLRAVAPERQERESEAAQVGVRLLEHLRDIVALVDRLEELESDIGLLRGKERGLAQQAEAAVPGDWQTALAAAGVDRHWPHVVGLREAARRIIG